MKANRLYVGIVTVLALCKYTLADWNATDESANRTVSNCRRHGNGDNCTEPADTEPWGGHFSPCPDELRHYCIHGECRYVKEQATPSCRCQSGYVGARCEYVDLDWRIGEKREIIIVCAIGGLVLLVLLVVLICVCSHRRSGFCRRRERRREEPRNGTEKLSMMDAGSAHTHTSSATDSAELPHTNTV